MGANISNQQQVYINYLKKLEKVFDSKVTLRKLIKQSRKWDGDRLEWRLHTQRNGSYGFIEDGGDFPHAGNQAYVPAYSYRKFRVGKLMITDGALATVKDGSNAAIGVLASETKGAIEDMSLIENWFGFRDGTGVVSALTSAGLASGSSSIPVTDGRFLKQFSRSNMIFEVYNAALTTKRGEVTVSKVANDLNGSGYALVDFNTTVTGAISGDVLVLKGSVNRAFTGLDKLIDDSASVFQGVNVATYPEYSSYVNDASGVLRALTPSLLRQTMAERIKKCGYDDMKGMTMVGTSDQQINLEEQYEGELRLTPSSTVGGAKVASFQSVLGTVKLVTDNDMLYNTLFGIDGGDVVRTVQQPLAFRKSRHKGSSGAFQPSQQAAYYEATLFEACDYHIENRKSSFRINDLEDDKQTAF